MKLSLLFPLRVVQDEIKVDDIAPGILDAWRSGKIESGEMRSNVGGWRSQLDLHKRALTPELVVLNERVLDFTTNAVHALHVDARFKITECWLNVLGPGGYNSPHDHYPNNWSGVLWIDAETNGAAESPAGDFEFHCPYPARAMGSDTASLFVKPTNGVAIFFPAGLKHMVHPVATTATRKRISLAWNVIVEPLTEKKS